MRHRRGRILLRRARNAGVVSPAGRVLAFVGLVVMLIGLVVALTVGDPYAGLALLIVGGFLLFLPFTRPSLDE